MLTTPSRLAMIISIRILTESGTLGLIILNFDLFSMLIKITQTSDRKSYESQSTPARPQPSGVRCPSYIDRRSRLASLAPLPRSLHDVVGRRTRTSSIELSGCLRPSGSFCVPLDDAIDAETSTEPGLL